MFPVPSLKSASRYTSPPKHTLFIWSIQIKIDIKPPADLWTNEHTHSTNQCVQIVSPHHVESPSFRRPPLHICFKSGLLWHTTGGRIDTARRSGHWCIDSTLGSRIPTVVYARIRRSISEMRSTLLWTDYICMYTNTQENISVKSKNVHDTRRPVCVSRRALISIHDPILTHIHTWFRACSECSGVNM